MKTLFELPRHQKRLIQLTFDSFAIGFCFWLAMALRLDGITTPFHARPWLVLLPVIPVTLATFTVLGLYRAVVRFMADRAVKTVAIGVAVSAVTMFVISQGFSLRVPRSVPGIYFALLLIVIGGTRFIMRGVYLSSQTRGGEPVLIYGSADVGRQVLQALEANPSYNPKLFVDSSDSMTGREVAGIRVIPPTKIEKTIKTFNITTAIVALPDDQANERRTAVRSLSKIGLDVRVIPNLADLISGRVEVSDLRRVTVEELLGRETVPPIPELMNKTTARQSVMVTGAGGSIGSELCRQIFEQCPKKLILFENSEFALYQILEQLKVLSSSNSDNVELIPIMGSVTNQGLVKKTIEEHAVETLFHAAAYKHVPLVEDNAIEGIRNNVFGTQIVAQAAGQCRVKHFTLISTDKAVRPTNIMGATKRIAELVMQDAALEYPKTKFCAVRFGNVLGSSGSVIPKFQEQIRAGGPITLTHTEITRYFMTIPEAAQLVIQASSMAEAGEIYLLDMGEPIKIMELARTMARLQGRETYVVGQETPVTDGLPIKITGLRPGEKLYEELLIGRDASTTSHPRIMVEPTRAQNAHSKHLQAIGTIENYMTSNDLNKIKMALKNMPIDYNPN